MFTARGHFALFSLKIRQKPHFQQRNYRLLKLAVINTDFYYAKDIFELLQIATNSAKFIPLKHD